MIQEHVHSFPDLLHVKLKIPETESDFGLQLKINTILISMSKVYNEKLQPLSHFVLATGKRYIRM